MKKKNSSLESAKSFLKKEWQGFTNSFRSLDRRVLYIVAIDLLFFIICIAVFFAFRHLILSSSQSIAGIDLSMDALKSNEIVAHNANLVKSFYNHMLFYSIASGLAILLFYAVANFFIWVFVTGKPVKKLKLKLFLNFLLANAVWLAGWIALGYVILGSIRPEAAKVWVIGIALVYAHLTLMMYISYFKRMKVKAALKKAFSAGITQIRYFIAPYILAAALFAAVNTVFLVFSRLPNKVYIFISTVMILFYFAWLRIYIYSFAKELA